MGDDQFEKRMALLKKSYERVPSSFDSEEVLRKIGGDPKREPPQKKHSKFKQNAIVWAVGIASVFLIGILSATYFLPDSREQANDEQKEALLLDIEKGYEEAREKKRKKLQLTEKQFSKIAFVDLTDRHLAFLLKAPYFTQEDMELQLEDRLAELALPSEMIGWLLDNPLREDEDTSIIFMTEYREKVYALIEFYNGLLSEEGNVQDHIIDAMKQQRIQYLETDEKELGEAGYVPQESDDKIKDALHENVQGYYDMLLEEPYMFGDSLTYSLEDTTAHLKEMEAVLIATKEESHLYLVMHGYYVTLFNNIVKGSTYAPIVDENRIVKEEYQQVWKELADGKDNLPTTFIMRPIVKEMEATGWKDSDSWDVFDYKDVEGMLLLAREGMLPKQ